MSPRRALATAVVPILAAAFVGLTPGVAAAANSCGVSGGIAITMSGGLSVLTRDAGPSGAIRLDGVPCDTATVDTIDIIGIVGSGGTLRVDLANGGFAPGLTPETDGLSEIEMAWNPVGTALEIVGDPSADDDIRRAFEEGFHLNGDADQDVALNSTPTSVLVDTGGGDDYVDMSPDDNGNQVLTPTIVGGTGNDVLRGDTGTDTISGGDGDDQIADGLGDDGTVSGGNDDDTLYAAKTEHDGTFPPSVAIPDDGSASDTLNVNGVLFAEDVEVRVTIAHPVTSTLTIAVEPPGALTPFVLASGLTGTGYYGTVFDDSAASAIGSGSGTYTGRFRPSGGTLASLLGTAVLGTWTLTVTDDTTDSNTGTLVGWEVAVVGAQTGSGNPQSAGNGSETYDGGGGTDLLSYAARTVGIEVDATTPASGTSGDAGESDAYTDVESVVGGHGDDTFHGSAGNDTATGGPGQDTFFTSAGDDTFDCDGEDDTVDYSGAPGAVVADLGAGTATGDGADTLVDCDSLVGSPFGDTLAGSAGPNTIASGGGADSVDAGAGDDDVTGSPGDSAVDTYAGGAGTDTIRLDPGAVAQSITLDDIANDGVSGEGDDVGSDFETVYGGTGDDSILGTDGPNVVHGGDGNDTIDGAGGDDFLDGEGGTNTLSFASSPAGITLDLDGATASGDGGDIVGGFANVIGSSSGDDLTTGTGDNVVRPGGGNDDVVTGIGDDVLVAEPAPDGADTWVPGDDSDTADYSLRVSAVTVTLDDAANDGASSEGDNVPNGVEIVRGGAAADSVVGGLEGNTFYGGGGNDTLLGRGGVDTLYGEAGDDVVLGSSGNDVLQGGIGNDTVNGGEGDDRLLGGANNDTLIGGLGDDDEFGETGNDRFLQGDTSGANGSDLLVGGTQSDTASYNGRAGAVRVDVDGQFDDGQANEHDSVSRDVEIVEGTAYSDTLTGNELGNTIRGLGGNDRITGLAGNDSLDGGTGNDTFVESATTSGADTYIGGSGADSLDYRARTVGIRLDLDNGADDGQTFEHDNARSDVEYVYGGSGNDVLTGNLYANRVFGGAGNDSLNGLGGADVLDGGRGNDTIYGRDGGRDTLLGGTGTDRAHRDAIDTVAGFESYF